MQVVNSKDRGIRFWSRAAFEFCESRCRAQSFHEPPQPNSLGGPQNNAHDLFPFSPFPIFLRVFVFVSCYTATWRFMDWDHGGGRATNSASVKSKEITPDNDSERYSNELSGWKTTTTRRMAWKKKLVEGRRMQTLLSPFIMLVISSHKETESSANNVIALGIRHK